MTEPVTQEDMSRAWYLARFAEFEKRLNGGAASPVHALRRRAIEKFAAAGFPTTRQEEWRFTNVAPIARTEFQPALILPETRMRRADIEPFVLPGHAGSTLVFVNGRFTRELSTMPALPAGVRVGNLASMLGNEYPLIEPHLSRYAAPEENAFTALSAAFIDDGAFMHLPDGTELASAVHLLFINTAPERPLLIQPRNLIIVGAGCRLSVVETHVGYGTSGYLSNAVTEIVLGADALVEHDRIQRESPGAYHVGTTQLILDRRSVVRSNAVNFGGSIVRNNVTASFRGEQGECTLNGLSLGTGSQLVDNHTTIDHAVPSCQSHELYKAILDGSARGVFNGKIFVRRDAQKTDAKQTNKTLLLSDTATIDTKPQLEIFADDVRCTHGATVGQLDEEQLFYLRSRGIALEEARDLLTFAFASDVIQRIHVEPLREQLDGLMRLLLRQGRVAER